MGINGSEIHFTEQLPLPSYNEERKENYLAVSWAQQPPFSGPVWIGWQTPPSGQQNLCLQDQGLHKSPLNSTTKQHHLKSADEDCHFYNIGPLSIKGVWNLSQKHPELILTLH